MKPAPEEMYSVKMRASKDGTHISGAERIVSPSLIVSTLTALAKRAFSHGRGAPDSMNIKVAAVGEPVRMKALAVFAHETRSPAEGWAKAEELLSSAGIAKLSAVRGLFAQTYGMRGAMLVDADTLERLEPDRERGVRATEMDGDPSPRADVKNHFAEALTLASKVLSAPGIVAELCVSDDPGYTTGYVALKDGYHRLANMKERGEALGGRIFFYRGRHEDVGETVRYLEESPVIVEHDVAAASGKDLSAELAAIEAAGLRREVRCRAEGLVSFASNDYLGLAEDVRVKEAAARATMEFGAGAGASRLVTGTLPPHIALERHLARFKGAEDAIVFSTGYMANLGAITAIAGKGDVILSDELNHASIIDGCRLSDAKTLVYPHLDMEALDAMLDSVRGARRVLAVSDGVFSMDGDLLDLPRFLEICEKHGAFSMVDEAHALGVVGKTGHGLSEHFGCGRPDLMMGTLSKALGSSGGYIAARRDIVEYLRQKSRPFIFNTAPNPASVAAADAALGIIESDAGPVTRLHENVRAFGGGESAIIPVVIGDERKAVAVSKALERKGFLVPAIRYPTVAKGSARLRVAVCAKHTKEQIAAARLAIGEASVTSV